MAQIIYRHSIKRAAALRSLASLLSIVKGFMVLSMGEDR